MIDINRRKKLAFHLRQLANGQTTNDEFEDALADDITFGWLPEQYYRSEQSKNDDPIIIAVLERSYGLYSDQSEHKLTREHELTKQATKEIAKWILFLQSNQEYDWESFDGRNPLTRISFLDLTLIVLTLGLYLIHLNRRRTKEFNRITRTGEFEFWPFKTRTDYELQLSQQPFLAG